MVFTFSSVCSNLSKFIIDLKFTMFSQYLFFCPIIYTELRTLNSHFCHLFSLFVFVTPCPCLTTLF
jgi:hypothetical protein